MGVEFIFPEFEVVRNQDRCIACRVCERQCANEVHSYSPERGVMISDETKCVNCQRCVSLCPTRALKIVKSDCRLREMPTGRTIPSKKYTNRRTAAAFCFRQWAIPSPCPFTGTRFS